VRRRKTETFGDLSHDVVSRIDPHGKRYESQAVQVWPEVAGEEIVKHTRGFAMREGELVVFVDSPAWANELSLMAERLKESINSRISHGSVRAIRFNVSKRVQEERQWDVSRQQDDEYYRVDTAPPIPLSPEELMQAEYMAEAVPDLELREKALKVMIKDLEGKKGARASNAAERATGGPEDANPGS